MPAVFKLQYAISLVEVQRYQEPIKSSQIIEIDNVTN